MLGAFGQSALEGLIQGNKNSVSVFEILLFVKSAIFETDM